mmetsp:Transcript_50015/g.116085  ORF Transcript_50015/g.116085 Transcript_50015/m.116085 type:complete len:230 (-) Transcript_50015:151-840(-)
MVFRGRLLENNVVLWTCNSRVAGGKAIALCALLPMRLLRTGLAQEARLAFGVGLGRLVDLVDKAALAHRVKPVNTIGLLCSVRQAFGFKAVLNVDLVQGAGVVNRARVAQKAGVFHQAGVVHQARLVQHHILNRLALGALWFLNTLVCMCLRCKFITTRTSHQGVLHVKVVDNCAVLHQEVLRNVACQGFQVSPDGVNAVYIICDRWKMTITHNPNSRSCIILPAMLLL